MKAAGLKAIGTVIESSAVLIKSRNSPHEKLVSLIAARIKGVIGTAHALPSPTTGDLAQLTCDPSCSKIRSLSV